MIDDDTRKAEIFNNYFMSVFKNENVDSVPNLPQKMLITEPLNNIEITRGMVEDKLLKLKVDKSPGPDGLHPRILKELGQVISYPLKIIFSKSLEEAHVPTTWKLANVKPIYKKGLKSDKANYRPVSLLSVLNKVLETLISERIVDYLMKNGLISKYQHGFVKGRFCLTELLEALEIWVDGLDNRISVDVVYFDIMKAFDTVPHRRLLTILGSFGISGNLVKWIEDYLSGRLQRVVINGCSSSWSLITSGVPQGSVLGPLLFLIFINGLTEVIDSHIRLFADDTKIFRLIRSGNDCDLLQNDILRLNQWAERWQINFHSEKTKVLRIGKYHPAPEIEYFMLNDTGNRKMLNFVTEEKDLGVIIDVNLNFKSQVAARISKANSVLFMIKRSFGYLDNLAFLQLYKVFVRVHLEFSASVWSPWTWDLVEECEAVQRRSTRMLMGMDGLSYEQRLRVLKLPTLIFRRIRGDLINVYKYVHGIYASKLVSLNFDDGETRGHDYKLKKTR